MVLLPPFLRRYTPPQHIRCYALFWIQQAELQLFRIQVDTLPRPQGPVLISYCSRLTDCILALFGPRDIVQAGPPESPALSSNQLPLITPETLSPKLEIATVARVEPAPGLIYVVAIVVAAASVGISAPTALFTASLVLPPTFVVIDSPVVERARALLTSPLCVLPIRGTPPESRRTTRTFERHHSRYRSPQCHRPLILFPVNSRYLWGRGNGQVGLSSPQQTACASSVSFFFRRGCSPTWGVLTLALRLAKYSGFFCAMETSSDSFSFRKSPSLSLAAAASHCSTSPACAVFPFVRALDFLRRRRHISANFFKHSLLRRSPAYVLCSR